MAPTPPDDSPPNAGVPVDDIMFVEGRPRIGLALGGGAARGWAHIGVLEALAENGIRPDVIAGTSIGAVVGGCFGAGKLGALKEFALSLTARKVFSLVDLTPLASGLVGGTKLESILREHLGDSQIQDIPTRTVFIASELATGHEIWLRRGELVTLMKASYALPGVFKPVTINGRALVDGALVNPVPVSVCRAYGARMVIAVNLSPETMPHGGVVPDLPDFDHERDAMGIDQMDQPDAFADTSEDDTRFSLSDLRGLANPVRLILRRQFGTDTQKGPRGIPAVMMQSYTIIQDRMTRSRLAGDPPDAMIDPMLGDVGMFDFHKAEQAIEAGRAATLRALDHIAVVSDRLSAR